MRRVVDAVGSTTADVAEYCTTSAGGVGRLVTPLSTPRSSPLPPHLATSAATGPCRWIQHHPQQGYGILDENVEDFALMASLVSASNSSSCEDILLKGP